MSAQRELPLKFFEPPEAVRRARRRRANSSCNKINTLNWWLCRNASVSVIAEESTLRISNSTNVRAFENIGRFSPNNLLNKCKQIILSSLHTNAMFVYPTADFVLNVYS